MKLWADSPVIAVRVIGAVVKARVKAVFSGVAVSVVSVRVEVVIKAAAALKQGAERPEIAIIAPT